MLRTLIRRWLGIESLDCQVQGHDYVVRQATTAWIIAPGFKTGTKVIIASKVGGGFVKIVDIRVNDRHELQMLYNRIATDYGASIEEVEHNQ